MSADLPRLFLARHGDTAWTDSRQHTGRTDLPLNKRGEERALQLGEKLKRFSFTRVFTSPLQRGFKDVRTRRIHPTLSLIGWGEGRVTESVAVVDPDLVEWHYGSFEGKLTRQILQERPGWEMFRDGCQEGESPQDVAARADRFIARVRGIGGDVLAFSSGHIIRMMAARWLGLPPAAGRMFYCRPASVGVLGFEHKCLDEPIIGLWNYVRQPRE